MTAPTTDTTLDARTVEELQPPCEQTKAGSNLTENCPEPATWIVWLTWKRTGEIAAGGRKVLMCDEHKDAIAEHMRLCTLHRTTMDLHCEPLR